MSEVMVVGALTENVVNKNKAAHLIEALFAAFEENRVVYCVLRNYHHLPYEHGNDVDIFVHPTELNRALEVVLETAAQEAWVPFATASRYGYLGIHLNAEDDRILIDIFSQCHWRGLSYCDGAFVLGSRRRFNGFWAASPGCEGAVTLVKELLSRGKMKERQCTRERVQLCASEDSLGFTACMAESFGRKIAEQICQMAADGDWAGLEEHVSEYRRALLIRQMLRMPATQLVTWGHFVLGHIWYRIRCPLGIFIVVIGPDGSGKTAIAERIMSDWEAGFHTKPVYIHGDFHVMPRLCIIKKFLAIFTRRTVPPEPDYTKRHSGAEVVPHSLWRSLVYLIYYYAGYLCGHILVFRAKGHDKLVIADRYFYDYFFQRGNMKLPHRLLKFLSMFIPRPDLTLYLNADAQEIYQRKDELTIEEIRRQQLVIGQVSNWLPNFNAIRSDTDIAQTMRRIKAVMFNSLAARRGC
jgi:hypothetical protein